MSNMGYCRHENTLSDLRDVFEQWDDFDMNDTSSYELMARKDLILLVREWSSYLNSEEVTQELEAIDKELKNEN